jgi:hypothetical protein
LRTDAPTARTLRDSPLGKAAILIAVLLAALLVARSCGSRETEVSKEEAVEIARSVVDYEPDRVMTRFVPRGADSRPNWAVSLSTVGEGGRLERITVVVVDGRTGEVVETRVQRG